jgi:tetratricopeptide (TPR) repeat protein
VTILGGVGYFRLAPQLDASHHWRLAHQAIEEGDLLEAQKHLQRCLEVWPNSGESHFLTARTLRRAGNFDAARHHLHEARRLGWVPELVDLESLLLQAQAGLVQPLEQAQRGALVGRPGEEAYIFEAMVIGYLQGNFVTQAYQAATRWTEKCPEDWQAHFWRGRVLEKGLQYTLAASEYQHVLDQKPHHLEAHLRRAEVLLWLSRHAEAAPHFERYLQGVPDHPGALLGLARCQRSLHPPEVALATLHQLLAKHQEHAGAFLLWGQLELDSDNAEQALTWLRRAEKLAPQDKDVHQNLAVAFRRLNKVEEAQFHERMKQEIETDFRRMDQLIKDILQKPKDVALRYEAGTITVRRDQVQQGARWFASALLIDPTHESSKKALLECLPKLGDPKLTEYYRQMIGGR